MALRARTLIFFFMSFSRSTCHSTLATRPFSLDHLVRSRQHIRWDHKADLLGGFQIDDELELRGLLNRKLSWLGALENFVHVGGYAPVAVREVRPVVHEPSGIYGFSPEIHR